jgi:hypothetical protein
MALSLFETMPHEYLLWLLDKDAPLPALVPIIENGLGARSTVVQLFEYPPSRMACVRARSIDAASSPWSPRFAISVSKSWTHLRLPRCRFGATRTVVAAA